LIHITAKPEQKAQSYFSQIDMRFTLEWFSNSTLPELRLIYFKWHRSVFMGSIGSWYIVE